MTNLPEKLYLKRKVVLNAVGGRSELEKHERSGELVRVFLAGYKCAHYRREEVQRILRKIHGDS